MSLVPIFIVGHSHTGTSILRSVIGHAREVFDIDREKNVEEVIRDALELERQNIDEKFVVGKRPLWRYFEEFYNRKFQSSNLHAIFVIRNPYFVFSSLIKRLGNPKHFHEGIRSFENFEKYAKIFHKRKFLKPHPRIHCIRYEDFFKNDHEEIKKVLDNIGIPWDDDVFDNTNHVNKLNGGLKEKDANRRQKELIDKNRPEGDKLFDDTKRQHDHHEIRNKQINQPFVYADTDRSKICLPEYVMDIISNSFSMHKIYPDFKL